MEEEDCGCQINKTETKEYIFSNPDTVGEEIFDEDDIFEKVKNYYKNDTEEEGQYLDDDLLLEDLNSSENLNKELMFINELRTNKINNKINNKEEENNKINNKINNKEEENNKINNKINNIKEEENNKINNKINNKEEEENNKINNKINNKEEEEKNYNPYKEKKINYIKDYLKKLKDGF